MPDVDPHDAPPPADPEAKKRETNRVRREQARTLLAFLNERTGRNYPPSDVNLDLIVARLKEGYSERQLRQVVAKKSREWLPDEKMAMYLRPATLFGRQKFAQYVGELGTVEESHAVS